MLKLRILEGSDEEAVATKGTVGKVVTVFKRLGVRRMQCM
jgi:hypothetical protein